MPLVVALDAEYLQVLGAAKDLLADQVDHLLPVSNPVAMMDVDVHALVLGLALLGSALGTGVPRGLKRGGSFPAP